LHYLASSTISITALNSLIVISDVKDNLNLDVLTGTVGGLTGNIKKPLL